MSRDEFAEVYKKTVVWHILTGDWKALCGSLEAMDYQNRMHSLTNQSERVTCPNCKAKMIEKNKDK